MFYSALPSEWQTIFTHKTVLNIALCIIDTLSESQKVVKGRIFFNIGLKHLPILNFNQPGKNINFPQIFQTFTENLFRFSFLM
jgi:hypothetical protein